MIEVVKEGISVDLYAELINTFDTHLPTKGLTHNGDQDHRKGTVRFIQIPKSRYLKKYELHPAITMLKDFIQPYGQNLMPEVIQVSTYEVGDFYKMHRDQHPGGNRRLSITGQLNDPSEYEGGEFCFHEYGEIKLGVRDVCIFDPMLLHEVKPVTKGVRHSMVSWFYAID
mgnify:FL=1